MLSEKLTVLHDNGGSFTDYSNRSVDLTRDLFSFTLTSDDYIYIGFRKPINSFFMEISGPTPTTNIISGEFYDGSWTSLAGFFDESSGFKRSGFISWDRGQSGEVVTTVNSTELFWYRFSSDAASINLSFKGINIVFSDDNDLKREYYEIAQFLPNGESSHIMSHVASRDHIVQSLRNGGAFKSNSGTRKDITAFDLHDAGQIRLASTYLSLYKIFSSVIDDPDDVFRQKAQEYKNNFQFAIRTPFIDLDLDDDGVKDSSENKIFRTTRVLRE